MTESASSNKKGKGKLLEIPVSVESVKQYKKALTKLHEYQRSCRTIEWPAPNESKELLNLIKKYENALVYGQLNTRAERDTHCIIRDSYKPDQLVKILEQLWMSNGKTSIRDMFCLSARHHMLLRDQDLRNLNFSDCFSTVISGKQREGSQQAVALVFSLDKGKTIKDGEVNYACALRHENLHRCPFSLFAFFVFSLFQVSPMNFI